MYNLMMKYDHEAWESRIVEWGSDRYLEYTDDGIKARFETITDAVADELKSFPTLFAHEQLTGKAARVGWIKSIQRRSPLRMSIELDPDIPPIEPDLLKKMLVDLDIDHKSEVHRTHWAIKDVDLIAVLRRHKVLASAELDPSACRFSRQTVIKACDLLRSLGHAGFDRLLLDIGLNHIDAGRSKGSLMARSVALGVYAVDHIDERTVDGEPLAFAIVRRAAESDPTYTEAEDANEMRRAFWSSLKRDGYRFEEGRLASIEAESSPAPQRPYVLHPSNPNPERPTVTTSKPVTPQPLANAKPKVFIVHGREQLVKQEVARFVERIGLEAVILHERPNGGRTLITKFQEESADIAFAIVLITPDDTGGLAGGPQSPRARQNVIFELGFFIGKLGAAKVCALVQGNVEKPSDFDAVVYVQYDGAGAWKTELARELKHAKVPFNADALI